MAVSADSKVFAAGFVDGGIGIWRTGGTGACEIIEAGQVNISSLAISPDGRFLVSSSWAAADYLWDLADGTRLSRTPLPAGVPVFSVDGRRLVLYTGIGRRVYEFDPAAICLSTVLPRQAIHSRTELATIFSIHPGGEFLIVPAFRSLLLVDALRGAVLRKWPIQAIDARFSADGQSLLLSGRTCTRIPLTRDGTGAWSTGLPRVMALNPGTSQFRQLRSTPDAGTILGWRDDAAWSLISGSGAATFPMIPGTSEFFTLSPDARWLAHGYRHAGVRIASAADGATVHEIPGAGEWNNCVFSPDGRFLTTCDGNGFRQFRAGTWEEVWHNPATGNGAIGRPAACDPSSRWLIYSPQPGAITLLDPETSGQTVSFRLDRDHTPVHFAMSPAGGQLWELDTATQVLWRWDLAALRAFLRARGLDWTDAPLPPPLPAAAPPFTGLLNWAGQE